jgi:hypothetical protein
MTQPLLCGDYRLGAIGGTLFRLPSLGVPDPYKAPYSEYSVHNTRGDMRQRGDGFSSATWQWLGLSQYQVEQLLGFINLAVYSDFVMIRTRTNLLNLSTGSMFTTFQAVLTRPAAIDWAEYGIQAAVPFALTFTGLTLP